MYVCVHMYNICIYVYFVLRRVSRTSYFVLRTSYFVLRTSYFSGLKPETVESFDTVRPRAINHTIEPLETNNHLTP